VVTVAVVTVAVVTVAVVTVAVVTVAVVTVAVVTVVMGIVAMVTGPKRVPGSDSRPGRDFLVYQLGLLNQNYL
jgi:hypothetical protein